MTIERKEIILGENEQYTINMGPQHPSTHGVLRFELNLKGEIVEEVIPHCGYIHRGIEKMCEAETYQQIIHLTDRMDYLSAHMNNEAVSLCVEKALEVEVPERVKVIRTILAELSRLAPVVVVCFRNGPRGADNLFLWFARQGKNPGYF